MTAALATFFGILGAGAVLSSFIAAIAAASSFHGSVCRYVLAAACVVLAALFIALSVYFAGLSA